MLLLTVTACLVITVQAGCPMRPTAEQTSASRTTGDGGYRILVSGKADKYIPNAVYTISLQGNVTIFPPLPLKRYLQPCNTTLSLSRTVMNRHWLISSDWTYKLRFTNFFERNETNVSFIFFYYNEIVYWIKKIGTNIMMMDSERRENDLSFILQIRFQARKRTRDCNSSRTSPSPWIRNTRRVIPRLGWDTSNCSPMVWPRSTKIASIPYPKRQIIRRTRWIAPYRIFFFFFLSFFSIKKIRFTRLGG